MPTISEAHLHILQGKDSPQWWFIPLGLLHPQFVLGLLAVRLRLVYLPDGIRIYKSQMFLLRKVLLKGVLGVYGLVYRGSILPCVLQNSLFATWMDLQYTGQQFLTDRLEKVFPAQVRIL